MLGSPLGLEQTAVSGIVSAFREDPDLIQFSAPISPGNSGGPVLNADGEVIGVTELKIAEEAAEGLGFAIPSSTVRNVVEQLVQSGTVVRPYVGVSYQTLTPRVASYYDLDVKEGALITRVAPNSPARSAGLQPGDVITNVDGQSVGEQNSLAQLLNKRKVNDEVSLTIVRDGQEQAVTARLAQRPSADN